MSVLNDRFCAPWCYAAPGAAAIIDYLRSEPEAVKNAPVIWKTRSKVVRKVSLPAELGGFDVAYKCSYNRRPYRYILRRSTLGREAINFFRLQQLGLPVVELLGVGDKRSFWKLETGFIVTRFADGFVNGIGFLPGGAERENRERFTDFVQKVLAFLAAGHRAGYYHGAGRVYNFLWRPAGAGVQLIALDFASGYWLPFALPKVLREKDLAITFQNLGLSPEDEKEFRRYYREWR